MHILARFSASARVIELDVHKEKTCIDRELNSAGMLWITLARVTRTQHDLLRMDLAEAHS